MKAGIAKKKMRAYCAYFLRLRQAVAHPFLLEGTMAKNFTLEDLHWLRQELDRVGGKTPLHEQVKVWIEMEYENLRDRRPEHGTHFGLSKFGYEFNMDAQLEAIQNRKHMGDVICRICYETPDRPEISEVC
jgi:hypothetical protein